MKKISNPPWFFGGCGEVSMLQVDTIISDGARGFAGPLEHCSRV